jgi:hypothetical protein
LLERSEFVDSSMDLMVENPELIRVSFIPSANSNR